MLARLEGIGLASDRFGLIHADLGFENVLVADDGTVTIIDFDDSGDSWYLFELASALYPHDRSDGFDERRDALVAGYRHVRELPDELLAELPAFLMARRIQTLGWVFSRPETAHAERQRPRRIQSTPAGNARVPSMGPVAPGGNRETEGEVIWLIMRWSIRPRERS